MKDVPDAVIGYISTSIGGPDIADLMSYAPSSRKRHRKIILKYLNISDDEYKQRDFMKQSEDRLFMTLEYLREYRTYFHIFIFHVAMESVKVLVIEI